MKLARLVVDAAGVMAAVVVAMAAGVAVEATAGAAGAAVDVATAAVANGAADRPARSRTRLPWDGVADPVEYSRTYTSLRARSLLVGSVPPP